jgi:N-acetylglucosamine-6-phosphate deacetylase
MIIKNAKIVLEDKIIDNGYLVIENEKIKAICEGTTTEHGIDINGS